MALEKDLAGRHIWEMSQEEQNLVVSDIFFLTKEAFRYYIFELIFLFLTEKKFYCEDIFLQQLFICEYRRETFMLFDKEEIAIMISFFENALDEIDEVLGDRSLHCKLEIWERVEVYHPFVDFEDEMKEALLGWKKMLLTINL